MHKMNMNVINCYPGAMEEKANEPEEGEIVDDYELISSDEELCMRQRIRELEEENAEIEQITVISRSYDIDRAARIPTDVSSISSTEFKTPKKRKRHKNKEHKKKTCHRHHSSAGHHRHHGSNSHVEKKPTKARKSRCKRREKLLSKKHIKTSFKDMRENLTLDSPESLNSSISSSTLTDSDCSPRYISAEEIRDENDYYHRPGIRNTLRLAVARSRKNSTRQSGHNVDLKERLLRKDLEFTGNQFSNPTSENGFHDDNEDDDDDVVICEPENEIQCVPEDSADSLEEKELRLIALKSAVLKKHMDRKRRNAEAAYSPTDFDDIISSCVVDSEDKLANLEVVDLDEEDSQNGCITVSPITSPQLMMLDGHEDSSQMVDCKPVDMDIANSDSEDTAAALTSWNGEMSSTIPYPPYPPNDLGNSYTYGLYLPEFNTNSINPPPPGVDDYEEMKQVLTMNFGKSHDVEAQDMDVENDEFEPIETYPITCKNFNNNKETITAQELKLISNSPSLNSNPMEEENQEEEEQALRALLLSKFNSPKNPKKTVNTLPSAVEMEKENSLEHQPHKDTTKKTVKPIEAILKEAVKRLKVVGMCKEEQHQETAPIWEQHLIVNPRKDDCANEIRREWDKQPQQESINDIPLPRINVSLDNTHIACPQESKVTTTGTVECLKRKVKELKNYRESKVVECNGVTNEEKKHSESAVTSNPNKSEIYAGTNANNNNLEMTVSETNIKNEHTSLTANSEENTQMGLHTLQQDMCTEKLVNPMFNLDEDTKRRLQKLKDEIINATLMKNIEPIVEMQNQATLATSTERETPNDCSLKPQNSTEIIIATKEEILSKKDTNIATPTEDCIVDKAHKNKESKAITISKTKKPNLNGNKGTLEVSLNKTALKENNLNKGSIKTNQEPKKIVRTLNKTIFSIKTKETKPVPVKNLSQLSTNSLSTASLSSVVVKPLPTYSVLRTTKIVKPNKVINTNIDLKRKVVLIKSDQPTVTPTKVAKTEQSAVSTFAPPATTSDSSRLITSMDQVKHMCNVAQLLISIQNSSNESSEDEWADCDSMYKPLYDYNDISSPLSLHLESPCLTPVRSNSPADGFEEKANNLTKTKRSPITFAMETTTPKTPVVSKIQKPVGQVVNTPVAVRHLPTAAQDEYRKLVNRMKLLENQRIRKESASSANESSSTSKEPNETNSLLPAVKPTLVKQVLLRNINNKTNCSAPTSSDATAASSSQDPAPKPHKANVLRTYESLYVKIGAGIVNNLDKSLCLVEEAKMAKINKLKLETRLKKLKAEMELLQSRHKEEEQKISRIYPSICSTNEVITSMKQKRAKVFKAAINLGKTLKGEEYRLNNELKQSITSKTKKLASEIKMVNSLKAEDIDKLLMEEHKSNVKDIKNAGEKSNCKESFIEIESSLKLYNNKKKQEGPKESTDDTKRNNDDDDDGGPNSKMSLTADDANSERCSDDGVNYEERNDDKNVETSPQMCDGLNTKNSIPTTGGNTEFQERTMDSFCGTDNSKCETDDVTLNKEDEDLKENKEDTHDTAESDSKSLLSYISPLDYLRNINGTMDPNGVVCPYDLMGNCEDASCKYVHISQNDKDLVGNTDL